VVSENEENGEGGVNQRHGGGENRVKMAIISCRNVAMNINGVAWNECRGQWTRITLRAAAARGKTGKRRHRA